MRFPRPHGRKKPIALFYSGFLTGDGTRETKPSKHKPDDWHHAITDFIEPFAAVHRATWHAQHLPWNWRAAVEHADYEAEILARWVDRHDHPIIMMGHSLGGRIVLKAAQLAQSAPDVIAFAPAIFNRDIDTDELFSPHRTVEIYRSPTDYILRGLFPVGEWGGGRIVGLNGIPSMPHGNNGIHCFNANKFFSEGEIGHLNYAENLHAFNYMSPTLRKLSGMRYHSSISQYY